MADRPYNVLFLCTGNSARSILAERIISQWGRGRFRGFSAGSHPNGVVHPIALELLEKMNLPTEGLRSKSWDEFAAPGAPPLDFVLTVCDNAAGEVCPYYGCHSRSSLRHLCRDSAPGPHLESRLDGLPLLTFLAKQFA